MRHITLLNRTEGEIVVEYNECQCLISSNCQQKICVNGDETLRIYKKESSHRLCFGQRLLRGTVKNIWLFGPLIRLNYDAKIILSESVNQIEVLETKKKLFMFFVYSLLLFNSKAADEYDYHNVFCRRFVKFSSALFILPFAIVSFILILISFYGMIFEFSLESVLVLILCFIPVIISFAMIKDLIEFINFKSNFLKKSKQVLILKDIGWFIKCLDIS